MQATSSTWPGPIDFSQIGLFGLWLDRKHFDVDRFVDTLGSVPADLVKAGFKLLKPTMDLSTNLNLWWNAVERQVRRGIHRAQQVGQRVRGVPGEFFRQWVRDFYQGNKLFRGRAGLRRAAGAACENIQCPVFVVGAKEDYIAPPACVRALIDAVEQPREGLRRAARAATSR